ncbi:UNVERIFIED_CONTAM: hypothetical protein GTU68_019942 [Idotea baltica]|nr:hypothetical protein [Idotea baltica]
MVLKPWKKLHGIFCIYKPPDVSLPRVAGTIIGNLVQDLNEEIVPHKENLVTIEGGTDSKLAVKVSEKLAVHPLAIGAGYVKEDIRLIFANHLSKTSSGVCIVGLNKVASLATVIKHSRLIRTYRISGVFGKSTINLHISGKVVEKSRYSHVNLHHLEKVLMTIQASHQKGAMDWLSANLSSQESYEALAEEGIVRPASNSFPLAYSLKCVEYNPPDFAIDVSCINENEHFLRKIIHDTGLFLKTNAVASKIRCLRYGPFTLDDALLRKHWRLEHVVDNIDHLRPRCFDIIPKSASLEKMEEVGS